jgi:hypothetical protein
MGPAGVETLTFLNMTFNPASPKPTSPSVKKITNLVESINYGYVINYVNQTPASPCLVAAFYQTIFVLICPFSYTLIKQKN